MLEVVTHCVKEGAALLIHDPERRTPSGTPRLRGCAGHGERINPVDFALCPLERDVSTGLLLQRKQYIGCGSDGKKTSEHCPPGEGIDLAGSGWCKCLHPAGTTEGGRYDRHGESDQVGRDEA